MRLAILLACCLLLQGFSSQVGKPRPKFSDYPVKDIYRGEPARPIITKEFRSFRTMIRNGADSDVEFAGHCTIPRWGCERIATGSSSSIPSVGWVYDGFGVAGLPFKWLEKHGGQKMERIEFHPNSRLLKINACPNETNCGFYDYVMV